MAVHGTAIALEALGAHEALPTRNHTRTTHPRYREMGGRALTETVLVDRLTCTRCPIRCRRVTASHGRFRFHVEGPDYAQLCAFGPNADLVDLEAIAYMNYLCYDLGLDPIEMGNTLAMLAEATDRGLVRDGVAWGDAARFEALIRQAGTQEGEWARLGLGASGAAAELGLDALAMSVKGISIQNVDPRPEPAWGLLNATESLGAAAHIWTYGDLVYAMRDVGVEPIVTPESSPREIAGAVKHKQDLVAALDAMTVCSFSSYAFSLDDYAAALSLVTHTSWSPRNPARRRRAHRRPRAAIQCGVRHRSGGRHPARALPQGTGPERTPCRQGLRPAADAPGLLRAAELAGRRATARAPGPERRHRRHLLVPATTSPAREVLAESGERAARPYPWRRMLDEGVSGTIEELVKPAKVNHVRKSAPSRRCVRHWSVPAGRSATLSAWKSTRPSLRLPSRSIANLVSPRT